MTEVANLMINDDTITVDDGDPQAAVSSLS